MTLTLQLNDEQSAQLTRDAKLLGRPVEEIAMQGIEDYVRRKKIIRDSLEVVLTENAELYRRLAQ